MVNLKNGPKFRNGDLRKWAVQERLPWLVENFKLPAGAICGSLDEFQRAEAYGLGVGEELPMPIDWSRNGIVISPPGTGKGMAIFVEALAHYEQVIVLVPSVIQAHKLEQSLDRLYHPRLGGCWTSQRRSPGLIEVVTTGIFHQMVHNSNSPLWQKGTVLIVDEAQRLLEADDENGQETAFLVGYMAHRGLPTFVVSATITPGTLPQVFGHSADKPALVYELEKEMHPVDLKVCKGADPFELLRGLDVFYRSEVTSLVFAPSRQEVIGLASRIRNDETLAATSIPVTGAHFVEAQLKEIERAQKSGKPVVVVATPGTMDSSVTIPGLETLVILDERIRVFWNQYGVRERRREILPINHIWQMIRRVGRLARQNGELDRVFVISKDDRLDIQTDHPTFEPLAGCSPWTPIENLLLQAVRLDVSFSNVHDFMVSTFPEEHIRQTTARLLANGMIIKVEDSEDPDGLELTEKGRKVVKLPFEYRWSRLIVEAPEELQQWLCLAASFGSLRDLQSFEESIFEIENHSISEVLSKIQLGVQYVRIADDADQEEFARWHGLSFRRGEQVETLFVLACEALGIEFDPATLEIPEGDWEELLLHELVEGGLRTGLFDLFLLAQGKNGGWTEARPSQDSDQTRRFFPGANLAFNEHCEGGVCAVVGTSVWSTARNGALVGNLENITVVPKDLVKDLIRERAKKEGWFELTFYREEHKGQLKLQSRVGRRLYLPSWADSEPEEGRPYWCSIEKNIARGVDSVWIHYPIV